MMKKSDLEILIDTLIKNLEHHIRKNRNAPYRLTPAEVIAVIENDILHKSRLSGCEKIMLSVISEFDAAKKKMAQQENRLAGSSSRAASLAKELKGYKQQVKELRSELYDIEIDREHGQEPEKTEIQKHDEAVRYKKQQAIRQAGQLYGEVKFDEERAIEQAADLYVRHIVESFSLHDAKIIRDSLSRSSEPSCAPIGQLYIMLVANLASYANITPNDIEVAHSKTNLANFLKEKPAWPTQTD